MKYNKVCKPSALLCKIERHVLKQGVHRYASDSERVRRCGSPQPLPPHPEGLLRLSVRQ